MKRLLSIAVILACLQLAGLVLACFALARDPFTGFQLAGPAAVHDNSPQRISAVCRGNQVNLNTGLTNAGKKPTDFGPCITAALSHATPAHPVALLVDGQFAISGIFPPLAGNWSLVGLGGGITSANVLYGTGFFQLRGSNNDMLHNGPANQYQPSQPGVPRTRGANVTLADFILNGNRGDGKSGNNTSGDPRSSTTKPWTFGIALHSLNHVRIRNLYTYNIATYNILLDNVGDAVVDGVTFDNTGPAGDTTVNQNGDGLHINGPANDIHASNITCRATDDCFALNAPENMGGVIERVTLSHWTADHARTCGRIYTDSVTLPSGVIPRVRDVVIDGMLCSSQSWAIMLGHADVGPHALTTSNSITDIRISNSVFSTPFGFIVSDTIGDLAITDTTWKDGTCSHDGLSQPTCGFLQFAANDLTVNHLALLHDTLKRTPSGNTGTSAIDAVHGWNGGSGNFVGSVHIGTLDLQGFHVIDEGATYPPTTQALARSKHFTLDRLFQSGNDFGDIFTPSSTSTAAPKAAAH